MTRSITSFQLAVGSTSGTLPSWLPPSGQIKSVGVNTLATAAPPLPFNPGPSYASNVVAPWCGMVIASTYGAYGSIVIYGGGHGDYYGNEVYRYDIDTRSWSRITDPTPPPYYPVVSGTQTGAYYVDDVYGEYWANSAGTAVRTGQPSSSHTYGRLLWCPPGSFGADPAGYLVDPMTVAHVPIGGRSAAYLHYVPLSTPVWTRGNQFPTTVIGNGAYGPALYDSSRNRIANFSNGNDFITFYGYYNCATGVTGTINITGGQAGASAGTRSYNSIAAYDSSADLYYVIRNELNQVRLHIINPTTNVLTVRLISNLTSSYNFSVTSPTAEDQGGFEWIQSLGQWVYYQGTGSTIYRISKPADPINGTWTITSQTFTGDAAIAKSSTPHYTRFRWLPNLSSFIWLATKDAAVQVFKA